jgi:iron complex outermembrane recepter protein
MRIQLRSHVWLATVSCLSLIGASGAVAQGVVAAHDETTTPDASGGLTDIVVTAQKRSENVQNVAASITAIGSQTLENRQVRDITDLQTIVPSLFIGQGYGANLVTLRGISTGVTSGGEDPSIAVHINGVYQPRSRSLDAVLLDLDRVEVLAGPQGTLYGRNATGGVINYITKAPTKEFEGWATGTIANYDRFAIRGGVSGPISDHASFRISAIFDDQGTGYTKNLTPNAPKSTIEANRVAGVHGALRLQPTDKLTIDLDGFYSDTKSSTLQSPFQISQNPAQQPILAPQEIEPHLTRSLQPSRLNTKYGQLSATVTWNASDNVTVKDILSYQNYKNYMNIDYDGSAFDAVSTLQDFKSRTIQNELDLTTTLFDDRLTSIYGAYYYNDNFDTTSHTILGFGLGFPGSPAPAHLTFPFSQEARSYAFFTDQTFKVTDRFRLVGGLRYNHDHKDVVRSGQIDEFGPGTVCPAAKFDSTYDAWTPKVAAQYDASSDVLLYAQWSKGYKSGGFPANSCSPGYAPEGIKGPEIGFKSEFLDHHMRFNAAAYYYDYSNIQVQKVDSHSNFFVQNAAAAVIKGVEFSVQGIVTSAFHVDLSGNFQSAKYTDFSNCNTAAFLGACTASDPRPPAVRIEDVSGNDLNRAPPYTINLGAEYNFSLGSMGSLLLRGESYWSGEVHFNEFGTPLLTQGDYSIQNAFLTFTPENNHYQLRMYIKNIADTKYKVSGFYLAQISSSGGNWGAPQTFGAEFTVRF